MRASARRHCVGVIGARSCSGEIAALAFEVGRRIAEAGWVLVCGGMGGVMEEACRGAHAGGGLTLGILPGSRREQGNPFLSIAIPSGLGEARNALVVKASEALIAVSGGYGTLSEIALANAAGIPVVGLRSWVIDPARNEGRGLFVSEALDPEQAVEAVRRLLGA
ncbi:MAG: TIGR00725 family protein [Spirochaetales bacterium]|nr:TIGR00725 family protein [Spirochaetales bacterium]